MRASARLGRDLGRHQDPVVEADPADHPLEPYLRGLPGRRAGAGPMPVDDVICWLAEQVDPLVGHADFP